MQNIQKDKKMFFRFADNQSMDRVQSVNRVYRRIFVFIICLILTLQSSIIAAADDGQSNNRTVKAGIFYFEGYHMEDEEGRLTGYGIHRL